MIEVQGLSKSFAEGALALDDVSFTARPGEVLGFLGPNGAGKTTTMRILAGYLRPTRGRAAICGFDVVDDSLEVRRRIGYLPEQVPLYGEMRVGEYLRHRAALKGVERRRRREAADEAIAQAGLVGEQERVIERLSKGFRQRVGLADALLHRPEVLILDEPTDGLDPNQRREVLDLIAGLGRERTVVLSTHVLPEVEKVCQRVVVIDRGKIVAQGTTAELSRRMIAAGKIDLICRGALDVIRAALLAVKDVCAVTPAPGDDQGTHHLLVELGPGCESPQLVCEELARAVVSCGQLRQITPARSSLEAVFRWLTQDPAAPAEERS